MEEVSQESLIYDWNFKGKRIKKFRKKVLLDDETLRDGLQSPSTKDPPIEGKLQLVRLMERLGIDAADIGFPGASKKMYDDVTKILELIRDEKMKIYPNCAARTHPNDIMPVIEISQNVGIPMEVSAFLGSSPIRQQVEGWGMDKLLKLAEDAINLCTSNDTPVMFVTEDTTRAKPEDILVSAPSSLLIFTSPAAYTASLFNNTPSVSRSPKVIVVASPYFLKNFILIILHSAS